MIRVGDKLKVPGVYCDACPYHHRTDHEGLPHEGEVVAIREDGEVELLVEGATHEDGTDTWLFGPDEFDE